MQGNVETSTIIDKLKVLTEQMESTAAYKRDDNLHREAAIIDSYADDIRKIYVQFAMENQE